MRRTGVIQPLPGIGDMVWHVPALRALAEAHHDSGGLVLITKASAQAHRLFAAEPMIAEVLTLPTAPRGAKGTARLWLGVWQMLKAAKLSRLYILHHSPRYLWAARLAGIRNVITYPPALAASDDNGWLKSLALLKAHAIAVQEPQSRLTAHAGLLEAMAERYASHPKPWLIVAPGATEAARRWPLDRFAICADALVTATLGTVFVVGSERESDDIDAIVAACLNKPQVVAVKGVRLEQVMALMAQASLMLGNDSGPINVAAALGIASYALCGVSEPARHSENLKLIGPDLAPDLQEDFGTGMAAITTRHVMNTLRRGLPNLFDGLQGQNES